MLGLVDDAGHDEQENPKIDEGHEGSPKILNVQRISGGAVPREVSQLVLMKIDAPNSVFQREGPAPERMGAEPQSNFTLATGKLKWCY
jgi:hypothetical protein